MLGVFKLFPSRYALAGLNGWGAAVNALSMGVSWMKQVCTGFLFSDGATYPKKTFSNFDT